MPPKVPAVPPEFRFERLALAASVFGGRWCLRVLLEGRCLSNYPRPPEFRFERLALAHVQYHNTHGMSKHIYL